MVNLYIRSLETREIVQTIPLPPLNTAPRVVELIIRGMLINLNQDKFFVDSREVDEMNAGKGE